MDSQHSNNNEPPDNASKFRRLINSAQDQPAIPSGTPPGGLPGDNPPVGPDSARWDFDNTASGDVPDFDMDTPATTLESGGSVIEPSPLIGKPSGSDPLYDPDSATLHPLPETYPHVTPQPVEVRDLQATRAIPLNKLPGARSVPPPSARQAQPAQRPVQSGPSRRPVTNQTGKSTKNRRNRDNNGCLVKGLIASLFATVLMLVAGGAFIVLQYFSILGSLPDINNLRDHASQFETTRILDREGNLLYEMLDPNAGRRTYVPLDKISPFMIAATIATEDQEYYNHPGYDPFAIARAFFQNYTNQEIVSGASTITQQLARNLLFSPEERVEKSIRRKSREIVLAAEITRRYSKDEILELYLNENFYGSLSYGVEAAAQTYFNTSATNLNLAQASFLAGLPQSPSVYDIHANPEATLARHKQVLLLMLRMSLEKSCIEINNQPQPVCVSEDDIRTAAADIEAYEFPRLQVNMRFPHWVNYIQTLLESQYDPQTIYRSGFTVYTTLDPGLQQQAEQIVKNSVEALAGQNVTDGALVAIQPATGQVLAMTGSADFYNEAISGQVNMAISPRQPGSAIKPLTYVAAFEKGWTPSTLIWDVPTDFSPSGNPDDPGPVYQPVNYDGDFHGPVTVRTALANSYNIPAVKAMQYVGIYDNPGTDEKEGFLEFARRLGISSLNRNDYGLALALGSGEVSLLEMTRAYSTFANYGVQVPLVAITKITDYQSNLIYEYKQEAGVRVVRPEHAYLISSILSDNQARAPMFGTDPVIRRAYPAAVKTGTTNDFRDNWTIGYTPDIAVGVWVGNADNSEMYNTTGLTGAAPIWAAFMDAAIERITGGNPAGFSIPEGIIERKICSVSGTEPSEWCPDTRREFFAADQPPQLKEEDLWQKIQLDTWTELRTAEGCREFTREIETANITETWARKWVKQSEAGKKWAKAMGFPRPVVFTPEKTCSDDGRRPVLKFTGLENNQTITESELEVRVQAYTESGFKNLSLQYGVGIDPEDWITLVPPQEEQFRNPGSIYKWDLSEIPQGLVTLKLFMQNEEGGYAEKMVVLNLMVILPTATETPTLLPTDTLIPTEPPTVEPAWTASPPPPATTVPLPTDTPVPEPEPTPTM